MLGVVAVMVAGLVAVIVATGQVDPSEESGGAIAPDGEEVEEAEEESGPAVSCRPVGCEVWRADVGRPVQLIVAEHAVYHADREMLVRLDRTDGTVLWEAPLRDSRRGPATTASPNFLAVVDGTLLVALGMGRDLQAWSVEDGRLLWEVPLDGLYVTSASLTEGHLLVSGRLHADGSPTVGPPFEEVAALDPDSGETVWRRDAHDVWRLDPFPLVQTVEAGSLSALDPTTGSAAWEVPASYGQAAWTDDRIAVVSGDGIDLLDPATGRPEGRLPVTVPDDAWISLHGDVLWVHSQHSTRDGSVEVRRRYHNVVSGDLIFEHTTAAHRPISAGALALLDDAIVSAVGDGQAVDIAVIDLDGTVRWRQHVEAFDTACCGWITPDTDGASVWILPGQDGHRPASTDGTTSDDGPKMAVQLDMRDGRVINRVVLPDDADDWGVVDGTLYTTTDRRGTTVLTSAGEVTINRAVRLVSGDRPHLVQTHQGLIAVGHPGDLPNR